MSTLVPLRNTGTAGGDRTREVEWIEGRAASTEVTMTLTEVLLAEAEANYAITESLFRRVADDELPWTPATGKSWMTVGQLLMHCASFGCGRAIQGFVTGDWGSGVEDAGKQEHVPPAAALPSVASMREALELLAADRRLARGCIRAAGEANLLRRMVAHLAQHKGQLFYYLKLMGKDVNTRDLWGA